MMAKEITSIDELEAATSQATKMSVTVAYASWHPPSKQMLQLTDMLCKDFPSVQFHAADVDKNKETLKSCRLEISSVPTLLFYENKTLKGKLVGFHPPKLTSALQHWERTGNLPDVIATPVITSNIDQEDGDTVTEEYLKKLVEMEPVMLFMKGTKSKPFCKFSKAAINLLNELGAEYGTFDILTDERVRSGMKEFSSWPTFPQLYIQGEFIGGIDIMMELKEDDSLRGMLTGSSEKREADDSNSTPLEKLVMRDPVMLFMKGTPEMPQCQFSSQICQLLGLANIEYGSFDILQNQKVREELKVFSEWPTYPQLYAGGVLIGGLDIVKEIIENDGVVGLIKELEEASGTKVSKISAV